MAQMPTPGTLFENRYLIDSLIGEGGFAAVFKARDVQTQRIVALKILMQGEEHWQKGTKLRQRFEREANLLAGLQNEHTVRLYEFDEASNGSLYLVFEFVDGIDLHDMLEQRGPLEANRVKQILIQVCSALQEAHERGVLHRDIKPANIMVYRHMHVGDLVKLLDFGIAKSIEDDGDESTGLTTAGIVLGTPRYMSPEQISGSRLEATSDIYSLGLVAFELLTGASPIGSESRSGIVREQLAPVAFAWPRDVVVPRSMRRVIDKMLEKDKRERYQSCAEVIADLQSVEGLGSTRERAPLGIVVALVAVLAALGAIYFLNESGTFAGEAEGAEEVAEVATEPVVPTPPAAEREEPTEIDVDSPPPPKAKVEPIAKPPPKPKDTPLGDDEKPNITKPPPKHVEIETMKLKSFAVAKSVALTAYMSQDYNKMIAACREWAVEKSFCARMLGEAYRGKGDVMRACYWFDTVNVREHGLECPDR